MNLTQLLDTLAQQGALPATRVKDLKTSIRYLAQALHTTPDGITDLNTAESSYRSLLTTYFSQLTSPPSAYTVRNTLNNLSYLFRTAHAHGFLDSLTPRSYSSGADQSLREAFRTSPYRTHSRFNLPAYTRPLQEWPADIREHWTAYQAAHQFEVRPRTLLTYFNELNCYVGYALTIEEPPITTWAQLFDPRLVSRFTRWHSARLGSQRPTTTGVYVAKLLITVAKRTQRPELESLRHLVTKLPKPEPMHDKQHAQHSFTLTELEHVGLTLRAEGRLPLRPYSPAKALGLHRAYRHQMGLIIRLLVRVPMRIRNLAEIRLERNLLKIQDAWTIRFQGYELKIDERHGRINVFQIPFPPDLIEHLEEFLEHHRPCNPGATIHTNLFLSAGGNPYSPSNLSRQIFKEVYNLTKKRFYPHLIRTIWTDTYLLKTHDISTAAFMLNDRPETVLQRYHELRANDHIQKANQFIQSLLGA